MQVWIVDAFTNEPFKGNPAGVCRIEGAIPDAMMLAIAAELNLSETAFIGQRTASGAFPIRYFSPKMEIPLCGHATLASARVMANAVGSAELTFVNVQGIALPVQVGDPGITMELPAYAIESANAPRGLLDALGLSEALFCAYNRETRILLLEIADCRRLRALAPNFHQLLRAHDGINGVLVTAISDQSDFDFESRYFWPWSGTDEDPVTGGSHMFLAPYWSRKLGKSTLNSFQCSRRSGFMQVRCQPSSVAITGQAVVTLSGVLHLPIVGDRTPGH